MRVRAYACVFMASPSGGLISFVDTARVGLRAYCAVWRGQTALDTTNLPQIEVVKDAETQEPIDFDVSNDPHAVQSIAGIEQFPLLVTISEVRRGTRLRLKHAWH